MRGRRRPRRKQHGRWILQEVSRDKTLNNGEDPKLGKSTKGGKNLLVRKTKQRKDEEASYTCSETASEMSSDSVSLAPFDPSVDNDCIEIEVIRQERKKQKEKKSRVQETVCVYISPSMQPEDEDVIISKEHQCKEKQEGHGKDEEKGAQDFSAIYEIIRTYEYELEHEDDLIGYVSDDTGPLSCCGSGVVSRNSDSDGEGDETPRGEREEITFHRVEGSDSSKYNMRNCSFTSMCAANIEEKQTAAKTDSASEEKLSSVEGVSSDLAALRRKKNLIESTPSETSELTKRTIVNEKGSMKPGVTNNIIDLIDVNCVSLSSNIATVKEEILMENKKKEFEKETYDQKDDNN